MIENLSGIFLRWFFNLLYHSLAWAYDFVAWVVSLGQWRSWVACALPYLKGPLVIEIGYGPGHLLAALARNDLTVIGIDASPQMAKIALSRLNKIKETSSSKKQYGYAQFESQRQFVIQPIISLAQSMPVPGGTANQVVATFPAPYIFDPDTLAEIYRVLTPGGALVVIPLAWIKNQGPLFKLMAWIFSVTGQTSPWNDRILNPFRSAGFETTVDFVSLPNSRVAVIRAVKPS